MSYLEALLELQVEGFRLVRDAEGYERPIEHEIADAAGDSVSPVGIDRRGRSDRPVRVRDRGSAPVGR
jgi:hypothetical protein